MPETEAAMEAAWPKLRLTVQVSTSSTQSISSTARSPHSAVLGRIEIDEQATGPQAVSVEDSTACIHGSRGMAKPASEHLLSELKIVAELAKATAWNARVPGTTGLRITAASATPWRRSTGHLPRHQPAHVRRAGSSAASGPRAGLEDRDPARQLHRAEELDENRTRPPERMMSCTL